MRTQYVLSYHLIQIPWTVLSIDIKSIRKFKLLWFQTPYWWNPVYTYSINLQGIAGNIIGVRKYWHYFKILLDKRTNIQQVYCQKLKTYIMDWWRRECKDITDLLQILLLYCTWFVCFKSWSGSDISKGDPEIEFQWVKRGSQFL